MYLCIYSIHWIAFSLQYVTIHFMKAQIEGIQIIVVAIGENLNELELLGIASRPDEFNYFSIPSISNVSDVIEDVINAHYNRM